MRPSSWGILMGAVQDLEVYRTDKDVFVKYYVRGIFLSSFLGDERVD